MSSSSGSHYSHQSAKNYKCSTPVQDEIPKLLEISGNISKVQSNSSSGKTGSQDNLKQKSRKVKRKQRELSTQNRKPKRRRHKLFPDSDTEWATENEYSTVETSRNDSTNDKDDDGGNNEADSDRPCFLFESPAGSPERLRDDPHREKNLLESPISILPVNRENLSEDDFDDPDDLLRIKGWPLDERDVIDRNQIYEDDDILLIAPENIAKIYTNKKLLEKKKRLLDMHLQKPKMDTGIDVRISSYTSEKLWESFVNNNEDVKKYLEKAGPSTAIEAQQEISPDSDESYDLKSYFEERKKEERAGSRRIKGRYKKRRKDPSRLKVNPMVRHYDKETKRFKTTHEDYVFEISDDDSMIRRPDNTRMTLREFHNKQQGRKRQGIDKKIGVTVISSSNSSNSNNETDNELNSVSYRGHTDTTKKIIKKEKKIFFKNIISSDSDSETDTELNSIFNRDQTDITNNITEREKEKKSFQTKKRDNKIFFKNIISSDSDSETDTELNSIFNRDQTDITNNITKKEKDRQKSQTKSLQTKKPRIISVETLDSDKVRKIRSLLTKKMNTK